MSFELPSLDLSQEVAYVALLFGLFVVPRLLQRFRVPAAITSIALGAIAGPGLGLFSDDATLTLLATLGIVSLFLFAGLEVEVDKLRAQRRILFEHLGLRLVGLLVCAVLAAVALDLEARAAALLALALLTPSTGFILDSLASMGLAPNALFWVRAKAIATEIIALGVMFVVLQSTTIEGLALSSAALATIIVVLPLLFRGFGRFVVPYAPKTEFAFLLMIAVVSAMITRKLGVYYLVGAFVVGIIAQRFRERLPAIASERMLHAVESFASIFVPFYFFHAGLVLQRSDFSRAALILGALFFALAVPARLGLIALHRRLRLQESLRESLRVGVPMLPTLVFTLVIAQALRETFSVSPQIYGGLIIYALATTVVPSFVFRMPPPDFETPEAPPLHVEEPCNATIDIEGRA